MKTPKPFSAITVPLQGSNLIEASAGTGKTYSIAILVLRLILEKQLSVKEVLMVTFTKAAVAELEERIRLFIRNAYKASKGERIPDETIQAIVNQYPDQQKARELLHEATLFLDETAVLTIHSFCQKTLNEFAFETNQLFGTETLQDVGAVVESEVNQYWRSNITSIPAELLQELYEEGLSRDSIIRVVSEHLSGKKYFPAVQANQSTNQQDEHAEVKRRLNQLKSKEEELRQGLADHVTEQRSALSELAQSNSYAKKSLLPLIDQPEAFLALIVEKKSTGYVQKLFSDLLTRCDECDEVATERKEQLRQVMNMVKRNAIHAVAEGITAYKLRNNQMTFDDMIVKLHDALVGASATSLISELQKKYKAVFVDEFQDTDRLQYEIFQQAFSRNTILFYIGDPKQSIYAWRKADIFTYFKAYDAVGHRYEMNTNFRSSVPMIDAMNAFFQPTENFDTFFFNNAPHAINYLQVQAPAIETKGHLFHQKSACVPIAISNLPNRNAILEAVTAQVIELLEGDLYSIGSAGRQRSITPTDIGILVRSNAQGRDVKNSLAKLGIPAVTIGDEKILRSAEATYMLYLLQAMIDNSRAAINKALLSPFTGFTVKEIQQLNDEKTLELFKQYKSRWQADGVYTALIDFVADFNVQQVLLQQHTEGGERTITNLFHLIELVHKIQTAKMLSPVELVSWLQRGTEGMETEGDEFEQRVESDEEAVRIVTIHKSKGLEYKIVLAPFLDFTMKKSSKDERICSFRDEHTGEYVAVEEGAMSEEQRASFETQQEQEFRRLLYVAITRAVYACFIYRNTHKRTSTLATFTNALQQSDPQLISWQEPLELPDHYRYKKQTPWAPLTAMPGVQFELAEQQWTRMSYTMLAAKAEPRTRYLSTYPADAYEHFVFHQLPKGERTGNLLHYIFENIHYSNNQHWGEFIQQAITRFAPRTKAAELPLFQTLVEQVLHTSIPVNDAHFSLSQVLYHKRIHEFEFDFPVSLFRSADLESLSNEQQQVFIKAAGNIEGMMTGKVDLFFEHERRYYVLDWKSNYLGDQPGNYNSTALAQAMNDNNYHLQYLLYTVAIVKYLQTRLPGFDYDQHFGGVIYLFVRGVRENSDNGIYTNKPSWQTISQLQQILQASSFVTG